MYYKLALITMESFITYSEKIGKNFLFCQGPGGNTSIKIEDSIYIKKSGHLLSNSKNNETFKKVSLSKITNFYNNISKDEKFDKVLSIETPLHVMLESKYVFHYHSIASILISSIYEKNRLNKILIKNKILPVEYIRPGINLAKYMISKNKDYSFKSYFLYNHGIVVEGQNVKKIYKVINDLEKFFSELIDYKELKRVTKKVCDTKLIDKTFLNPNEKINYKIFNGKYLFPDHSVFFPKSFDFDKENIYLEKELNLTELQYLKTLLILYNLIDRKKIFNFIDTKIGEKLRKSEDEQLRLRVNK